MRLSRKVFLKEKEAIKKQLGYSEELITKLIKMDHDEATSRVASNIIAKQLSNSKGKSNITFRNDALDLFDSLWFYKRNIHLVAQYFNVDVTRGVNTESLNKLEQDMNIDTIIAGKEYSISVIHRIYPLIVNNQECYWTIKVFTNESVEETYSFSFNACEKVLKVYMFDCKLCKDCEECNKLNDDIRLRPRFRTFCSITEAGLASPIEILGFVMSLVDKYVNREKLSRKPTESGSLRSIMIEHENVDEDTTKVLSLYQYTKEYKQSKPYVYKGGHHKSPVSHPRSGYYRRCKHGDYVLEDNEFKKVTKGLGQFTYVRPTLVNANKDSVQYQVV